MRSSLLYILLFLSVGVHAQHIERYYDYLRRPAEPVTARLYSEMNKKDSVWERKDYFIHERSLQMHGYYFDTACKIPHGYFQFFYPNKHLSSAGLCDHGKKEGLWMSFYPNGMTRDSVNYLHGDTTGTSYSWYPNGYMRDSAVWNADGSGVEVSWFDNGNPSSAGRYSGGHKLNGDWQFFHKNGRLSALETYHDGLLTESKYFDEEGNGVGDTAIVERKASFPGGSKAWIKYINKHVYFPDRYKFENADSAIVVIAAVVDEDGNVTDVEVNTPLYPAFDDIALTAVKKSPKWIPAMQHNRRVKWYFLETVHFWQGER